LRESHLDRFAADWTGKCFDSHVGTCYPGAQTAWGPAANPVDW
jgi:hypothetical protein